MPDTPSSNASSIVVIGAGLSGLATLRALTARGLDALVLEAGERTGGVIRSGRVAERVLEWGPQRARLTPALRTLVQELALDGELIEAPADLPLFVYRAGRLHTVPFSAAAFLRTSLFSTRAKLRVLAEPFTRRLRHDESVANYVRRRFGSEVYLHLIGPLFGGLYASDPEQMLARHALAPLLRQFGADRSALLTLLRRGVRRGAAAAPPCSFRDGLQALPDALYARFADRVRLGERVYALQRAGNGFVVVTSRGTHHCEHIVLTVDAMTAATLLRSIDAAAAERLTALKYNEFAIVHLVSKLRLRGMGFQVSLAEPAATRGVTFNDALFQRDGVHTAFLGGARDPLFVRRADDEIGQIARDEFHAATGAEARVIAVARARMPAWDASWAALDGFVAPRGVHLCANYESRPGIPGRFARAEIVADALSRTP